MIFWIDFFFVAFRLS